MLSKRTAALLTTILAIASVGLTAFAAADQRWFVAESSEGDFAVGLISAEMCVSGTCRKAAVSSFDSTGESPRLGLAVFFAAVLAGFLLFASTARMLIGSARFPALPKLSLFAAIFAAVIAGAWLLASPWSESMVPGVATIFFFIGTALAAATAAVPLGALRAR